MTRIKICGITNLADARYAAGAGADYLGFVLHPGSPRYIDAGKAAEIIEWVHGPRTVGVFVNLDPGDVNRIAEQAGFDLIQLHGDESPEECRAIDRPVIKAIRIDTGVSSEPDPTAHSDAPTLPVGSARDLLTAIDRFRDHVDYFLFDTASESWGGSGHPFDWSILDAVSRDIEWFLAGGLNPDNVAAAVTTHAPFAVDTSSGVESEPGKKDFDLVDAFIDRVTSAAN